MTVSSQEAPVTGLAAGGSEAIMFGPDTLETALDKDFTEVCTNLLAGEYMAALIIAAYDEKALREQPQLSPAVANLAEDITTVLVEYESLDHFYDDHRFASAAA